jgi:hypothetical protein
VLRIPPLAGFGNALMMSFALMICVGSRFQ